MKKQNSFVSALAQIRLGGLCLNNAIQKIPQNPVWNGDIPQYDGSAIISIRDISEKKSAALITWNIVQGMGRWVKKSDDQIMLIADRVLLANVSWNDLARNGFTSGQIIKLGGQKFFCRLLPVGSAPTAHNAWASALHTTTKANDVWHWKNVYFWGENINPEMTLCTIRGNLSAFTWSNSKADIRSSHIGFRPVLEPMNADANDFLYTLLNASNGASEKKTRTKTQTKTAAKTTQTVPAPEVEEPVIKEEPVVKKEKSIVASPAAQMLADALHEEVDKEFAMQNQRCIIHPNGALWTFDENSRRWRRVMDVQQIADMVNDCNKVIETPNFTPKEKDMLDSLTIAFGAGWLSDKRVQRTQDGSLQIVDDKDFQMSLNKKAFPSLKPGQSFPLHAVA